MKQELNKALELGLEWAETRMASELTEMDKEHILTGIKASLVNHFTVPSIVGRSEEFKCSCGGTNHYQKHDSIMCTDCGTVYTHI